MNMYIQIRIYHTPYKLMKKNIFKNIYILINNHRSNESVDTKLSAYVPAYKERMEGRTCPAREGNKHGVGCPRLRQIRPAFVCY